MLISIGLPSTVPDTPQSSVLDWAREVDQSGFSGVATLERLVYDSYDSLTTLAAAAAVTTRAKLLSSVLLGPLHKNVALFAKQVSTISKLSGGRLTVGVAAGSRPDDFNASGVAMAGRGGRLTRQVEEAREIWGGARRGFAGAIGPAGGPQVLLGGHSAAAVDRAARIGDGWIAGGGGVDMFRARAEKFRSAWRDHGRPGEPRVVALSYFSLGATAGDLADEYLLKYYAFAPPYARMVRDTTPAGAAAVRETIERFAAAGCDELVLSPCSHDIGQLAALRETLHR
ncbi:LLM class flavin-dependent oxidoreductase [Actinophytocola sp.]|uniref:LLM class flavin-dependent oxidoreductase n=1 Tax=Actinophytocola sp. TaxID=1872138 RepID=UPI002D6E1D9F|nr:LLM class flavin-dependent oxidoreductase [Actinophytocola sp.]HYQ67265.1 LLM class flavin-dependent oxidoreductase [Actinophytocola sp.]